MKTNGLHPQWILVARIGWILITLFFLTTFLLGLPTRHSQLATPCDASACPVLTLSSAEAALIDASPFSMQGYAAFHIGVELTTALMMSVMATLIFWKSFDNWMGILTACLLIYIGLAFFVQASHVFATHNPPVEWVYNQISLFFIPLILLVVFIFPNGRFLNKLSLSAFIIAVVLSVLELIRSGGEITGETAGSIFFLGMLAIGIWSQIHRYHHHSSAIEKQQTKWVLLGITSLLLCMAGWSLIVDIFPPSTPQSLFLTNTIGVAIIFLLAYVFPVSMMIAIMRYGLWGIDVIIRRTAQYGVVSVLLAAAFFGSITLLQAGLATVTGAQSPLAIVLSTLLIAALFNPLRDRVQTLIDRRFFRQKYNAQQVLAQFAQTTRDEVEIDALQAELVRAVQETMQPDQISVYVKPQGN